jgi:hypothetical protein
MEQREIKFRAWNIAQNKMHQNVGVHPHLLMDLSGDDAHYKTDEDGRYLIGIGFTNYRIMQYAGSKDKNGKELYEGDVVKRFESDCNGELFKATYSLIFKEGCFKLEVIKSHFLKKGMPCYIMEEIEIIGNIYENSELIK